jgi:hypothetical protein
MQRVLIAVEQRAASSKQQPRWRGKHGDNALITVVSSCSFEVFAVPIRCSSPMRGQVACRASSIMSGRQLGQSAGRCHWHSPGCAQGRAARLVVGCWHTHSQHLRGGRVKQGGCFRALRMVVGQRHNARSLVMERGARSKQGRLSNCTIAPHFRA